MSYLVALLTLQILTAYRIVANAMSQIQPFSPKNGKISDGTTTGSVRVHQV